MIPDRNDYHYVTGDLFARDVQNPGGYTVKIDGTSAGRAPQGSVRRLVPHGEDICWLWEAFSAREGFLHNHLGYVSGVAEFIRDADGRLTGIQPYNFRRGPRKLSTGYQLPNKAEIETLVTAHNYCYKDARFLYPAAYNPQDAINTYTSCRKGVPDSKIWGSGYSGYEYPLADLPAGIIKPAVIGERLASMTARMDWFKFGLVDMMGTRNWPWSVGCTCSVTKHGRDAPDLSVDNIESSDYCRYWECVGDTINGSLSYTTVRATSKDSLTLDLGGVHDWIACVRPVYKLGYAYYHQDAGVVAYSGQGSYAPAREYQIASDGTVTLQPATDTRNWDPARHFGGTEAEITPSSGARSYYHRCLVSLDDVYIIATFDDAICNC